MECITGSGGQPESPPPAPSRGEVADRFEAVASGELSRDAADRWAMQWVASSDPGVDDPLVWNGLVKLAGIDLLDGKGELLYSLEQVEEWLAEYRREMAVDEGGAAGNGSHH
jgi:hypothetical protein